MMITSKDPMPEGFRMIFGIYVTLERWKAWLMSISGGNMSHIDMESVAATKSGLAYLHTVTQQVQTQMSSRQSNSQWRAEVMLTDSLLEDILIAQYRLPNAKEQQG